MFLKILAILFTAPLFVWSSDGLSNASKELSPAQGTPLKLSLKRAVQIAISPEGNANVEIATQAVKQARARSAEAMSAFFPDVEASASEQNAVQSLGALGFTTIVLPFGLKIPEIVGPFNVIDIRATGAESFDFSSIRRFQASRSGVRAATAERKNADNVVAALAARSYLAALYADAGYEAATADVNLARALLSQAQNQKSAGSGTGIEVTRARVQLSNEEQRQLVAANEQRKAHYELLRAIGLRMDTEIELTDKLSFVPVESITLEKARAEALKSREDFKAQQAHENTARLSASAVTWERLPTISGYGNYGTTGEGGNTPMLPTRVYGVALRVPVFDGGRRDARRFESVAQYRQEEARSRDMREQIELDLREALDSLNSARGQIEVAQQGLTLADSELAQARRRYAAGVTNSIEVTDAQTRLERARDNQTAALFNYNLARIDLSQAMGTLLREIQ